MMKDYEMMAPLDDGFARLAKTLVGFIHRRLIAKGHPGGHCYVNIASVAIEKLVSVVT